LTHRLVTLLVLGKTGLPMPDYGEILEFLAANPPQLAAERELHASLLELIAKCLRSDAMTAEEDEASPEELPTRRIRWVDFH
jgi:hypothetical protein